MNYNNKQMNIKTELLLNIYHIGYVTKKEK